MNSDGEERSKGLGICEYRLSQDRLVLSCADSCKIRVYQLEMLANNPHPGILAIEKLTQNNKVMLSYNITGKVVLTKYLQETEVTAGLVALLYNTVATVLSDSENYLLDPAGFFLEENYLFIDPRTSEAALVYVPVLITGNGLAQPEELFLRLLKEGRLKIKSGEHEKIRALEEYLESEAKPGLLHLSELQLNLAKPVKGNAARDIRHYKLDEGRVMEGVPSGEGGILSRITDRKRLLVFISLAFPVLFLALAIVRLELPAGNFLTYGGLLLITVGINLLFIRKVMSGFSGESVEALFLQGKEAAKKPRQL